MFFSKTNTNLRRIVTSLCTKSYICPWSRELERSRTAGVGGIYRTGHGSGNDGHPSKVHLRRYLQPWCNRLAEPETLTAAVIQCLPYIGFPAAIKALRIIKEEYAK